VLKPEALGVIRGLASRRLDETEVSTADQFDDEAFLMRVSGRRSVGGAVAVQRWSGEPTQRWNERTTMMNPTPPAVPATLDLDLEDYYAAASLIGLLSSQIHEPDKAWVKVWAADMGEQLADEIRKRRGKRRGKRR
jgi:hypothetical protein